jgi:hypothetical protein
MGSASTGGWEKYYTTGEHTRITNLFSINSLKGNLSLKFLLDG